jgi:hypothetical protein
VDRFIHILQGKDNREEEEGEEEGEGRYITLEVNREGIIEKGKILRRITEREIICRRIIVIGEG